MRRQILRKSPHLWPKLLTYIRDFDSGVSARVEIGVGIEGDQPGWIGIVCRNR